ncbi:MAG: class I SAM-dependent methyltransferase [Gemmataceae bacterium]
MLQGIHIFRTPVIRLYQRFQWRKPTWWDNFLKQTTIYSSAWQSLYWFVQDRWELWTGRRDALTPPRRLLFDGVTTYEDFDRFGRIFLEYLIRHGLQPHHAVLDVGSGNGKNARALTKYLNRQGHYEGFDIVPKGVTWCQKHITPRFPNFRFQLADLYNKGYNPTGAYQAADYRFPYADNSFDLVFLTSVFTHLLPLDVENYVAQIARVLKPGSKCMASFFLLTPESKADMARHPPARQFIHPLQWDCCRVENPDIPEAAIAFEEEYVCSILSRNGLRVDSIGRGNWCKGEINSQDMVWIVKA